MRLYRWAVLTSAAVTSRSAPIVCWSGCRRRARRSRGPSPGAGEQRLAQLALEAGLREGFERHAERARSLAAAADRVADGFRIHRHLGRDEEPGRAIGSLRRNQVEARRDESGFERHDRYS